jgi:hypothetical protein
MSFLYPSILFFIGLIALPVIIHLFRFRKFRIVYFSNLRFLRDATLETRSRSRLKHLLVLLCRILAILALVFAFSQPFLPGGIQQTTSDQIVAIYIDNSFSMQQQGETGTMLEEARSAAIDIISAYPPSTRFIVISNDFDAWSNHSLSKDKAMEMIATVGPSRLSMPFLQVYKRLMSISAQQEKIPGTIYLLSDFQQNGWQNLSETGDTTSAFVTYRPAFTRSGNLSIDTCFFEYPGHYPGSSEILTVRLINYSDESYLNVPVSIYLKDSLAALAAISTEAESSSSQEISFTSPGPGIVHGRVEINDHPVTYDNTLYFTYTISPYINVLCINDKNSSSYIDAFFRNDSAFRYRSFNFRETDYSIFPMQQLVILNETGDLSDGFIHECESYMRNGGHILYIPSLPYQAERANRFLSRFGIAAAANDTASQVIYSINENSVLFRNTFQRKQDNTRFPRTGAIMNIKASPATSQPVAASVNGLPLITETKVDKGKLYTLSFALSAKDCGFATDPLFVPFLYNMALFSQPAVPLFVKASEHITVPVNRTGEKPAEIVHTKSGNKVIPLQTRTGSGINIFPDAQNLAPGNYNVLVNDSAIWGFSVNAERTESDNLFYSAAQIDSLFAASKLQHFHLDNASGDKLTRNVVHFTGGVKLWYYFILAALFFILAEIVIIRKV